MPCVHLGIHLKRCGIFLGSAHISNSRLICRNVSVNSPSSALLVACNIHGSIVCAFHCELVSFNRLLTMLSAE